MLTNDVTPQLEKTNKQTKTKTKQKQKNKNKNNANKQTNVVLKIRCMKYTILHGNLYLNGARPYFQNLVLYFI